LKTTEKDGKSYQSIYLQKMLNPDDVMVSKELEKDVPF